MRYLFLVPAAAVLAGAGMLTLTARPALAQTARAVTAGKSWVQPKTQWGDPDLQGTWTSDDCIGTPLNRPANLGDRGYYTEQELAEREKRIETQHQNDLKETADPDARVGTGPPGHWGERARRPCKQTSLVVDPLNGRTPDLLPEARTRPIPEGAGNNAPKADSWEDFTSYLHPLHQPWSNRLHTPGYLWKRTTVCPGARLRDDSAGNGP